MASSRESKRPQIPASKRASPRPTGAPRSVAPAADLATRVAECEDALRAARAEIDLLRAEIVTLATKVESMHVDVVSVSARVRKLPPPLPETGLDEAISVDLSDVVLESIRPPVPRRR